MQDNPITAAKSTITTNAKQATSRFFELINPLLSQLISKNIHPFAKADLIRSSNTYPHETYQIVNEYLQQFDLSKMIITKDVALWLLKDPFGNMLRRPIIYGMMCDLVLSFPAADEMTNWAKSAFALLYRREQFDLFDHRLPKLCKGNWEKAEYSKYMVELLTHVFIGMEHVRHLKEVLTEEYCKEDPNHEIWFSDPGHGLGYAWDPQDEIHFYRAKERVPLNRALRFMHIEDDPSYFWTDQFDKKLGFDRIQYRSVPEQEFGEYQFYTAANVIETINRFKSLEELPELVLSDIELPDGNGLDLVRKLSQKCSELGVQPMIFIYSSFLEGSKEQVEQLISEGLVQAAYSKQGFLLEDFIRDVNSRL